MNAAHLAVFWCLCCALFSGVLVQAKVAAPPAAPSALPPSTPAVRDVKPVFATAPVATDPDDPAVWINPADPARSLLIGTNKSALPDGSLYVWDLTGKQKQIIPNLDRPNNVDVEYGLDLGNGKTADIVVVTERNKSRLRIFAVATQGLTELEPQGGIPVFVGEKKHRAAPMGIGLYKRPRDKAIFAIVGRKSGPASGYLWQYRLTGDGKGGVQATLVRKFGAYSGRKEIEAVAVDDALGFVYYADERFGIRKYQADPDSKNADKEVALFGTSGFQADHEGIALWTRPDGTGYVVCTDQIAGNSEYHLFTRDTKIPREVAVVRGGADETDGIEIVSAPLGPRFPQGLLVVMNSGPKNFLVYDWRDIAQAVGRKK